MGFVINDVWRCDMRYFEIEFFCIYKKEDGDDYNGELYHIYAASEDVPSAEDVIKFCARHIRTAGRLHVSRVREISEFDASLTAKGTVIGWSTLKHMPSAKELPLLQADDDGAIALHCNYIAPYSDDGAMICMAVKKVAEDAVYAATSMVQGSNYYGKAYSLYRKLQEGEPEAGIYADIPKPQKTPIIYTDIDGKPIEKPSMAPDGFAPTPFDGRYSDIYVRQDVCGDGEDAAVAHILPMYARVIYVDNRGAIHGLPEKATGKELFEDFIDFTPGKGKTGLTLVSVFIGNSIVAAERIPDIPSTLPWATTPSPRKWEAWSRGLWADITNAVMREMELQCKSYLEEHGKHGDSWEYIKADYNNLISRTFMPGKDYRYIPDGEYVDIAHSFEWNEQAAEKLNADFAAEKKRLFLFGKKEKEFIHERASRIFSIVYGIDMISARDIWNSIITVGNHHAYKTAGDITTMDWEVIIKAISIADRTVNAVRGKTGE